MLTQTAVLPLMAAAAPFVANAPAPAAFPVNLLMLFIILYALPLNTADISISHISYLFLVFISPVTPEHLPMRLLGVFAGAVSIILYQLINGRKHVRKTARGALGSMMEHAQEYIKCLLLGKTAQQQYEKLRENLCKLSQIVYDRRKHVLCVSDAGFAIIDTEMELENVVLMLYETKGPATPEYGELLSQSSSCLEQFLDFTLGQTAELPVIFRTEFDSKENSEAERFYRCLQSIRLHMADMSRSGGIFPAGFQPACRMHSACTAFGLPHGK